MADTQRSISDLLTALFQDGQAAGAISEQDVRDLIVSFSTEHAGFFISASAATTIVTPGTFVKLAGTSTAIGGASAGMTHPSTNRLDYDATAVGLPTRHFQVDASITFTTASNNQVIAFALAKNGTVIANSQVRNRVGTGTDVRVVPISWDLELASTDFVEIWVTNETSATAITADRMSFSLFGHIQ